MSDIQIVEVDNDDIRIFIDGAIVSWSEIYGDPARCRPLMKLLEELLKKKVDSNELILGDTKCKITYDEKGLVISGEDLTPEDLPELLLEYIIDVEATAEEVNILHGVIATTEEINKLHGLESTTEELNLLHGLQLTTEDLNRIGTQLGADKVESNAPIKAGTASKITFDEKGLVVKGENLSSKDIPSIPFSKIWDVDTTAQEVNRLKGLQVRSDDLNKTFGTTENIQKQFNDIRDLIPEETTVNNSLADKKFVINWVDDHAGYYVSKDEKNTPFTRYDELCENRTFYRNGEVRRIATHDYALVTSDETRNNSVSLYVYRKDDIYAEGHWRFMYKVANNYDEKITFNWGNIIGNIANQKDLKNALDKKQPNLVNQDNIKSVDGVSLLGKGDLTIDKYTTAEIDRKVDVINQNIENANDYNNNLNKPVLNGVTLEGNLSLSTLGIASESQVDEAKNYNNNINKPSINGVTLVGNKSLVDLGIPNKADIDSDIDEMKVIVNNVNDKVSMFNNTITGINNTVSNLDNAVSNIDSSVLSIGDNVNTLADRVGTVEHGLYIAGNDLQSVGAEVSSLQNKVDSIDESLSETNSSMASINNKINGVNQSITTINNNINDINGSINTVNGKVETVETSISTINGKVGVIESDIAEINQKLEDGFDVDLSGVAKLGETNKFTGNNTFKSNILIQGNSTNSVTFDGHKIRLYDSAITSKNIGNKIFYYNEDANITNVVSDKELMATGGELITLNSPIVQTRRGTKSFTVVDSGNINDYIDTKIDVEQGVDNAGKVLQVNEEGNVGLASLNIPNLDDKFKVVEELPAETEEGVFYFVIETEE